MVVLMSLTFSGMVGVFCGFFCFVFVLCVHVCVFGMSLYFGDYVACVRKEIKRFQLQHHD